MAVRFCYLINFCQFIVLLLFEFYVYGNLLKWHGSRPWCWTITCVNACISLCDNKDILILINYFSNRAIIWDNIDSNENKAINLNQTTANNSNINWIYGLQSIFVSAKLKQGFILSTTRAAVSYFNSYKLSYHMLKIFTWENNKSSLSACVS